jgi:hypothetical protein
MAVCTLPCGLLHLSGTGNVKSAPRPDSIVACNTRALHDPQVYKDTHIMSCRSATAGARLVMQPAQPLANGGVCQRKLMCLLRPTAKQQVAYNLVLHNVLHGYWMASAACCRPIHSYAPVVRAFWYLCCAVASPNHAALCANTSSLRDESKISFQVHAGVPTQQHRPQHMATYSVSLGNDMRHLDLGAALAEDTRGRARDCP